MPRLNKFAFNGGELSPWLSPRIDLEKYHSGVSKLENMRVIRYGGASARAGTVYANEVKDSARKTIVKGFNFSRTDSVMLEIGHQYIRFYKNHARLGAPYELTTPYDEGDLYQLQFAQRNDVIIITHPDHGPRILSHLGDTSWTIAEIDWKNRAWQDMNETDTTMTPSALTGAGITITASSSTFAAGDVGRRIRMTHTTDEDSTYITMQYAWNPDVVLPDDYDSNDIPVVFAASSKSHKSTPNSGGALNSRAYVNEIGSSRKSIWTCIADYDHTTDYVVGSDHPSDYPDFFFPGVVAIDSISVKGGWEFETKSSWIGVYSIQRSYDSGTSWETVKTLSSNDDANFLIKDEEEEEDDALFRVVITEAFTGYSKNTVFRVLSREAEGSAEIVTYTNATTVDADVEVDFSSTNATKQWSYDSFSSQEGYPGAVTFHEERLWFGGVASDPQTVWASKTNDYYNFQSGTEDDNSLVFTIASNNYNGIVWLSSHKTLLVGTTGSVWSLGSTDDAPITPSNRRARLQTALGGADFSPININDATAYIQREGRRVNEILGDAYAGYGVVDLSELAEHVTTSGIVQIASTTQPDSLLLAVRDDGELAIMVYDKANRIAAWSRYTTGIIESAGTIYGTGEDDDIYLVVKRTVDGQTVRYIEYIEPDMDRAEEENRSTDFVFQDSSLVYDSTSTTSITGLSHLEGETVQVLADGAHVGSKTVASGAITLDKAASKVVVGLAYTPRMVTMPLEQGMTLGEKKSVNSAYVRLKASQGCEMGQEGSDFTTVTGRDASDDMDTPVPTRTKDYPVTIKNNSKRQQKIEVRQVIPAPLNIIAIMPVINTGRK